MAYPTFITKLPKAQQEIAKKLHTVLLKIQPDYAVAPAWSGLGYKLGDNYSCMLAGYKDHLKLMIWRGVDLKDPKKKLQGEGSNTQHLRLASVDDIDEKYLKQLLAQQFKLFASGVSYENESGERLSRARHRMPAFVKEALEKHRLAKAYRARPPYQRNDYLGWILEAKRPETQQKRLSQMLDELEAGDIYMKMDWNSST